MRLVSARGGIAAGSASSIDVLARGVIAAASAVLLAPALLAPQAAHAQRERGGAFSAQRLVEIPRTRKDRARDSKLNETVEHPVFHPRRPRPEVGRLECEHRGSG